MRFSLACFWTVSAVLTGMTRRPAKTDRTINCCCWPRWDADHIVPEMGPPLLEADLSSEGPIMRITTTESVHPDGTELKDPDESKVVESFTSMHLALGRVNLDLSVSHADAESFDTVQSIVTVGA